MKITRIEATGMKGQTFTHHLTALTSITGENFKGKTSRLAAIQLALLGYIPGDPAKKTNGAIMDFAQGTELKVKATLEDGTVMMRRFWEQGGTKKREETHDGLEIPLLDASAFFKMGPTAQLAFMFAKVTLPADYTIDGIIASLKAIPVESPSEHTEKAIGALAEKIRTRLEAEANGLADGIAAVLQDRGILKTTISYQKQRVAETQAYVRQAIDLRTREGECSAETLAALDAELQKARAVLTEINTRNGALDQRATAARDNTKRFTELRAALDTPARNFASEIATKKIALNTCNQPLESPLGEGEDLDSAIEDARSAAEKASQTKATARTHSVELKAQLADKQAIVAGLAEMCECDRCGGKGAVWEKKFKVVLEANAKAELDKVQAAIEKAREAFPALETAATAAKSRLNDLTDYQGALETQKRTRAIITREIAALEREHADACTLRSVQQEQLNHLEMTAPPTEEEFEAIQREIIEATETVEAIDTRRTAAIELAQEIKRSAESAKEHTVAEATLLVAKLMEAKLKATQAEMIEKGIGSTIDRANRIVGHILPSPLAFHDGDIGRWSGAKFIKTLTLSGTEEALTFVGMAAALSSAAALKLAIIDEFDRLDDSRQAAVIASLETAVQNGLLDQVIIASPRVPAGELHNWTSIAL